MAIAFARARYIGRSTGGSAVRSAAYNAREGITDERTGELFYFKHRDAPEHHEVLLPEGADASLGEASALWNAAEAAEKRKDAQVARELVIALPANAELSDDDRVELVRSFVREQFVSKGLAAQLDIHAPHGSDAEGDSANHHAHVLVTTRRLGPDGLDPKKARDLDPEVRRAGSRAIVAEGEHWGELWRDHQNRYFAEHGLELRVDATSSVRQEHVGPVRMRAADSEANARAMEIARQNAIAARDPEKVLEVLTRNNATFTERDVDRYLSKHIREEAEHLLVKEKVLAGKETLALHDPETGELTGRYTTRSVRDQERSALADAGELAGMRTKAVGARHSEAAVASRSLREDQRAAFGHAVGAGGLKVIEGRAGTGKSYTLQAVRDAHERAGRTVIGLGPTNTVAQDLKADGFVEAATAHSELFRLKNGRTTWSRDTVVIVDEAAMMDSKVTGELLSEARRSGAKLILAGDDRQLASIERGGLFAELRSRYGSAVITEVTRQKVDWQRQAARDLAEGRFGEAVSAFDRHGAVTWTQTQDQARAALVERWKADTAREPDAARFVFAYTNKDVDALNVELRTVRRERGELGSPDVRLATKHGEAEFAVGDRVQFTDTLKGARIYNGNVGTISGIDAKTGVLRATLDGAAGQAGREVVWSASEFEGFRHGYAGTIYKGQGKTLDHTYLYHSHHWRSSASYVALTRQRESAQVFVATETARDARQLARQMSRGEVKAASVAWATAEELPLALRPRAGEDSETDRGARQEEAGLRTPERVARDGWLIPPSFSADDRDNLARALDAKSVAAVVSADRDVAREQQAQAVYLQAAYKDAPAAKARLEELVSRDGHVSAARRLAADPGRLGELRGRAGLLAGAGAKQERANALRAAEAVGASVARLGEARVRAERVYRGAVDAQRSADATGVPKLSPQAEAALAGVSAAVDESTRVEAWRAIQGDERITRELAAFRTAAEQRFGADGVRAMLRAQLPGGAPFEGGPSLGPGQQHALAETGRVLANMRAGEGALAAQTQKLAQAQRVRLGARLKP